MPSHTPAAEFNYNEVSHHYILLLLPPLTLPQSLSLASLSDSCEEEAPPLGPSHAISQSGALPVPSTLETPPEADTVEPPHGRSIFKKWLQGKGSKGPTSRKPDRHSGKSCEPRSPSHSPARVDDRHEGRSRMAVGQPTPVSAVPR